MRRATFGLAVVIGLVAAFVVVPATSAEPSVSKMGGGADCGDFSSQAAAQNYFENQGPGDPAGLDEDSDGVACEANPCPCSDGGAGGGGGGGGGASPPMKTEKVCGKFVGISGSRVCLKKTTQGDKLKQVRDFRFRGLPAQCENGVKPKVAGKRAKIDGDGKKFRSRRLSILGNFSGVDAKAVGELKDGGEKVRGEVRVRFRNDADVACDTRDRKFKVS